MRMAAWQLSREWRQRLQGLRDRLVQGRAALDAEGLDFPLEHARSVQFHPEAGPGPHDAWPLISQWVEEVACAQAA